MNTDLNKLILTVPVINNVEEFAIYSHCYAPAYIIC